MEWITLGTAIPAVAGIALAVFQLLNESKKDRYRYERLLDPSRPIPSADNLGSPRVDQSTTSSKPSDDSAVDLAQQQVNQFERLWEEAQIRLARYHELAVIQGRQSFRMLLLFSALGFTVLGVVIWKATGVESVAGGAALGAAGSAAAGLTAYISRTFMRAYQDANDRLVDYFAEPLDMSRLLASERLIRLMTEPMRDEAVMRTIDSALALTSSTGHRHARQAVDADSRRREPRPATTDLLLEEADPISARALRADLLALLREYRLDGPASPRGADSESRSEGMNSRAYTDRQFSRDQVAESEAEQERLWTTFLQAASTAEGEGSVYVSSTAETSIDAFHAALWLSLREIGLNVELDQNDPT